MGGMPPGMGGMPGMPGSNSKNKKGKNKKAANSMFPSDEEIMQEVLREEMMKGSGMAGMMSEEDMLSAMMADMMGGG